MKKSGVIVALLLISYFSFSQKIDLVSLDSIPELKSNTSNYWSQNQCWVIPSLPKAGTVDPTGNILAYSFFNEPFKKNHHCGPAPFTFEIVNDSLLIGASLTELFTISPFGIESVYKFSAGNERIFKILPSTTDTILFATDKGLYQSLDKGLSFDNIEEFSNSFFLQNLKVNDIIYSIFFNNSNYLFQSRNSLGEVMNSVELDFTPFAFILYENTFYFTSADSQVISLDLTFSNFTNKQIPEIGETGIIKLFQDQLFIYKFREQEVLYVDEEFNIVSTESVTNSKLLFSPRSEEFYLYTTGDRYIPTSLNPLRFDTITPNVTATELKGFELVGDRMVSVTPDGIYSSDVSMSKWSESETEDSDGHGSIRLIGLDNLLVSSTINLLRSTDGGNSFQILDSPTRGLSYAFGDSTISVGFQVCSDLGQSARTLISPDGGDTWPIEIDSPRCFKKRFHTVTDNRVYFYDSDESYALSPGNAIYSWFSYYNRNDKTFFNVGGDPATMPFIPTSSNQLSSNNVSFYVSPDEIFYANPLKDNVSGYHSLDRGSTWIETPDSPTGRIYPTADSIGTIVIQNDPDRKLGTKFFLRYDLDEPYVELNVSPELPPIEYLKYTSDGRMIVASETGYFYITDGITSAIDDISTQQNLVKIYPNPTSDILHIISDETIQQIRVTDIDGQLIHQVDYIGQALSTSTWSSGMYIMEVIMSDGQRVVEKVVKM